MTVLIDLYSRPLTITNQGKPMTNSSPMLPITAEILGLKNVEVIKEELAEQQNQVLFSLQKN